MAEIFRWGGFAFTIKPTGILAVNDIEITGKCETEDSVVDEEKFVTKKNADKYTVTLTAIISAQLGQNVRQTVLDMTEAARTGEQGYIYTAQGKLLPCPFMLISAKASNIDMGPSGQWLYSEVALTLNQCAKYDGTTGTTAAPAGNSSGGTQNGKKLPVAKEADAGEDTQKKKGQEAYAAEVAAKAASRDMDRKRREARLRMSGGSNISSLSTVELKMIQLDPDKYALGR